MLVHGKPFCLGLWDTPGYDDYDRLRPLAYPGTVSYSLVSNCNVKDVFIVMFDIGSPSSLERVLTKWALVHDVMQ